MKCDKLQRYSLDVDYEEQAFAVPDDEGNYMESSDVIEAIAELNAALDKEKAWSETLSKNGVTMSQEIEQLKAALESEKASRYAECVDAGMRERRLKRALWLAMANDARNSYLKWNLFANFESEDKLFTIDEYDETPGVTDGHVLRTYTDWMRIWKKVGRKCFKKAEEYK